MSDPRSTADRDENPGYLVALNCWMTHRWQSFLVLLGSIRASSGSAFRMRESRDTLRD